MPPSLFFPESGPTEAIWVAAAKAVCASCPVRVDCLEAGMPEYRGVWGGLTRHERIQRRDAQRAQELA